MTANGTAGGDETLQASAAAVSQPREMIALCAAKTAGLAGATAQRYVRTVREALTLRPCPQASGIVRPLEKAIRLRFVCLVGPWLLAPILCIGAALLYPHVWFQSLLIAVIFAMLGLPLWYAQFHNWRQPLVAASPAMLPEAGMRVGADSAHLKIGETTVPWADVRLEGVELRYLWQPRIFPTYRVDRLRLAVKKKPLILDVHLIENGQEVADTICSNLACNNLA